MKQPLGRLGATVLCLLTAASFLGCAGTALRPDTSGLEQEIQRLRAQVVELQRQAAMDEVELARLRQQLSDVEARRSGGTAVRPAPRASEPRIAQPAPTPVPRRQNPAPARPQPSTPTRSEDPPIQTEAIEQDDITDIELPAAPAQPRNRPSAPASPPAAAADEEVLPPASQALYDRGYTLYHQAHFVDAETSFQRFLQGNPKSELADNAQYWIGECRYARGDLRGALAAFRETVTRFPEGNKIPDALLKAGQCLEALDDIEGARTTYREVARRFPGTAAATFAEERRSKLR